MTKGQYVVIQGPMFWCIDDGGYWVYDDIETEEEARDICSVMNDGFDASWDITSAELERRREADNA